jgi:hypothetical protein
MRRNLHIVSDLIPSPEELEKKIQQEEKEISEIFDVKNASTA